MTRPEELLAQAQWLNFVGELWLEPPTERYLEGVAALAAVFPEVGDELTLTDPQGWRDSWYLHLRVPGKHNLSPYESCHMGPSAELQGSERIAQIAATYHQAGFSLDPYTHEPADHLGHELRFLAALAAREAELAREGKETGAERVHTWILGFARDHPQSWVPAFVEHCQSVAREPYFVALARISWELVRGLR